MEINIIMRTFRSRSRLYWGFGPFLAALFLSTLLICQAIDAAAVDYSGKGLKGTKVSPVPSEAAQPPKEMDPIEKENVELMINMIRVLGYKKKADNATAMLKNRNITVKDLEGKYGGCWAPTGEIILNSGDVYPWKGIGKGKNSLDGASILNNTFPKKDFLREQYSEKIFIGAITLYHELIHCLQQPATSVVGVKMGNKASMNDDVPEILAHGKDIIFSKRMLDKLDELYRTKFKEDIPPGLGAKLKDAIIKSMKESYMHLRNYKKPSWQRRLVTTGEDREKLKNFELTVDDAMREATKDEDYSVPIPELPRPEQLKTVTEIDKDLGLLEEKEGRLVFTSTEWIAELAGIYNQLRDSEFKSFLGMGLGDRTNIHLAYEDGQTVSFGLQVVNGDISTVFQDAFDSPSAEVWVSRLALANILNSSNIYEAAYSAYEKGDIRIEHRTFLGSIWHFFNSLFMAFRKGNIVNARTEDVFPMALLQEREDIASGQKGYVPRPLTFIEVPDLSAVPGVSDAIDIIDSEEMTNGNGKGAEAGAENKAGDGPGKDAPEAVPELPPVQAPEQPPEPAAVPAANIICGNGIKQGLEECDPPGLQAQCYEGGMCNDECLCDYATPEDECGDGVVTGLEVCDGSEYIQRCKDDLELYKEMYSNPDLYLRCFKECMGCEVTATRNE